MSIFRSIISVGLVVSAVTYAVDVDPSAPAMLDDFNDAYGGSPNQNTLGAVYGNIAYMNKPWLGGGFWYTYADANGSIITNALGEEIVASDNEATMVPDSALHVLISTSTSTNLYPYAAVGCNLIGEGLDFLDLSKMTAITLRVKGEGTVRLQFETKDFVDAGYDWGQYGKSIILTADWNTVEIPVAELLPELYSPMDDDGWTWSHGSAEVYKLAFQVKNGDDADFYADDIALVGMTYADFGWTVSATNPKSVRKSDAFSVNASAISFNLPQIQNVNVSIHDMLGNQVRSLFTGNASAKTINWNSNGLSSGNYMVILSGKNCTYTQPLIITK